MECIVNDINQVKSNILSEALQEIGFCMVSFTSWPSKTNAKAFLSPFHLILQLNTFFLRLNIPDLTCRSCYAALPLARDIKYLKWLGARWHQRPIPSCVNNNSASYLITILNPRSHQDVIMVLTLWVVKTNTWPGVAKGRNEIFTLLS